MSEEDEGSNQFGRWVKPCKCRGTAKWVHEECLQRWIDEKQKNNTSAKVSCSQCNTEYLIVFPKMSRFFRWAQSYDNILTSFAPLASAAIFLGSVYWCAISYGALTVVQVVGQEEGKLWLENADPITLMVGLPSIPTFLILGKLIRWEDALIKLWQRDWVSRIPLLRTILRAGDKLSNQGGGVGGEEAGESDSPPRRRSVRNIPVNHRSNYDGARIFCGALLLPTVATFVGRLIYPFVSSDFNRAMLVSKQYLDSDNDLMIYLFQGGLTFILSKGMLNIYLRQQQRSMAEKRQVLDYDPELEAKRNKAAQTDSTTSTPNGPGGAAPGAEDGHAVEPANGQPPVPGPGFHLQIQFGNP